MSTNYLSLSFWHPLFLRCMFWTGFLLMVKPPSLAPFNVFPPGHLPFAQTCAPCTPTLFLFLVPGIMFCFKMPCQPILPVLTLFLPPPLLALITEAILCFWMSPQPPRPHMIRLAFHFSVPVRNLQSSRLSSPFLFYSGLAPPQRGPPKDTENKLFKGLRIFPSLAFSFSVPATASFPLAFTHHRGWLIL